MKGAVITLQFDVHDVTDAVSAIRRLEAALASLHAEGETFRSLDENGVKLISWSGRMYEIKGNTFSPGERIR